MWSCCCMHLWMMSDGFSARHRGLLLWCLAETRVIPCSWVDWASVAADCKPSLLSLGQHADS